MSELHLGNGSTGSSTNGGGETYDIEQCRRDGYIQMHSFELREEERRRKMAGNISVVASNFNVPLMALNTTKAGMEGLDVDTINRIITESSEGSKFYEHKKKQQEKIDRKIHEMKMQLQRIRPDQIEKAQFQVDRLVAEIEENLDLSRYFVHLDMDAFFASVEMRDDPSLREVPMAVGSDSMLSTSNYIARRYGVRAAMPGFIARKLCPSLRIIPCNYSKYESASKIVENVLKKYDQDLFMCMDEGDLDITNYLFNYRRVYPEQNPTAYSVVEEIRREVEELTLLTASAGIAPTRFLAKLCSDMKKPNGQCMLENSPQAIKAFLSTMPIRKVCGIGAVTEQMLHALDIYNCKELWDKRAILSLLFRRATFQNLLGIAMGTGSSVFKDLSTDPGGQKSLSCERTFIGTSDLKFLENLCKNLCSEIEKDLKTKNLCCKTITLKIKTTEYEVKTRARSIMSRTDSAAKIFEASWKIFMSYVAEISDLTIRLMGIRVLNLEQKAVGGYKDASGTQKTLHQYFRGTLLSDIPLQKGLSHTSTSSCDIEEDRTRYCYMTCPVCDMKVQEFTVQEAERVMDVHIDECLSKTKLREVKSDRATVSSPPKKRVANSTIVNDPKKPKRASDLPIDAFFPKL